MNYVNENMQVVEREVLPRTYGGEYVSKLVYEDTYRRVTVWFDEYGFETKASVKDI